MSIDDAIKNASLSLPVNVLFTSNLGSVQFSSSYSGIIEDVCVEGHSYVVRLNKSVPLEELRESLAEKEHLPFEDEIRILRSMAYSVQGLRNDYIYKTIFPWEAVQLDLEKNVLRNGIRTSFYIFLQTPNDITIGCGTIARIGNPKQDSLGQPDYRKPKRQDRHLSQRKPEHQDGILELDELTDSDEDDVRSDRGYAIIRLDKPIEIGRIVEAFVSSGIPSEVPQEALLEFPNMTWNAIVKKYPNHRLHLLRENIRMLHPYIGDGTQNIGRIKL